MSSSKKHQSTRKTETPDWAADVRPSEDVMAMFYAPTGQPKQGPLIPLPQPDPPATAESSEPSSEAEVEQIISADQQSDLEDKVVKVPAPEQSARTTDVQSQAEAAIREETSVSATLPAKELSQDPAVTEISKEPFSGVESTQPRMSAIIKDKSAKQARAISSAQVPSNDVRVVRIDAKAAEFKEYFGQWEPFLTEGQVKVLRALFEMTHAIGRSECLTSTSRLAAAAGMSVRQTSAIARDLEKLGFISRPETFNTRTKKGTVFELFLTRQNSPSTPKRHYHFED